MIHAAILIHVISTEERNLLVHVKISPFSRNDNMGVSSYDITKRKTIDLLTFITPVNCKL